MKPDIKILFNRGKLLIYTFGALAFVCAGVFFIYIGLMAKNQFFLRLFLLFLGVVSTSFFGLLLLILLPKAIKNKAGLVITDKGLYDYSSAISAGFITWTEIKKISRSYSGANFFSLLW
ncbi:STM3941 family protein [Lacibacter sp.]|uniref:STM3941 family protein n=1 Tax=Lacibacter sp. TaxID=1915409 RepID=UPI002B4B7F8A|nr:STM3941 family protein [Lacibacter sp.]HLP38951.1 STM3941 family protein [Lacibacter sp.]